MTVDLGDIRVRDCMHAGIVSCAIDTPLDEVARMMGDYRVHAIAVADVSHGRPWGAWRIVSDMDIMAALAAGTEPTAGHVAAAQTPTVSADEPLERAAKVMAERGVAHLIVVDSPDGYPVGIISTLDVASAYGGVGRRGTAGSTE